MLQPRLWAAAAAFGVGFMAWACLGTTDEESPTATPPRRGVQSGTPASIVTRIDGVLLSAAEAWRPPVRASTTTTSTSTTTTTTTTIPPAPPTVPAPPPAPVAPAAPAPVVAPVNDRMAACARIVGEVAWPPGWSVSCQGGRVGVLGLTHPGGFTEMLVRDGESDFLLQRVAIHEAGHAFAFTFLIPRGAVDDWCVARGCQFAGPSQFASDAYAEDWASVWEACRNGQWRDYVGLPYPSGDQCQLQNQLVG